MVLGLSICLTLLDNNRPPSVYKYVAFIKTLPHFSYIIIFFYFFVLLCQK